MLTADAAPPVVAVGAGPIYDLEDWADSPVLSGALFCSVGRSLLEGLPSGVPCRATELTDPLPSHIVQRIHNPVVRLRIVGAGFMPVRWSHPSLKLHVSAGGAVLEGENVGRKAVTVQYHAPDGEQPVVEATRANGAVDRLPTEKGDAASLGPPGGSGALTEAECEVFGKARAGEAFVCPVCGGTHDACVTRCLAGHSILGVPVYPSLPSGGFVVLSDSDPGACYRMVAPDTLPLSLDRVAVRDRLRATVYVFDPGALAWTPAEPFAQYTPLGRDAYAVFV